MFREEIEQMLLVILRLYAFGIRTNRECGWKPLWPSHNKMADMVHSSPHATVLIAHETCVGHGGLPRGWGRSERTPLARHAACLEFAPCTCFGDNYIVP